MKKPILFLSLLAILLNVKILGQETNKDLIRKWSISFSYAPISTFYYYGGSGEKSYNYYTKGIREVIYPLGANLAIHHDLNNRFSFSSGLNIKARYTDISTFALGLFYYSEESTDNRFIFEIPLTVNYNLLTPSRILDPYLKTGLRTTYFKRYYVGEFASGGMTEGTIDGEINNHDGRLILFYEIGTGTYINVSNSISAKLESNLTYTISGFGYLELQLGFRYSFK
jgi:hypothetical protein